jgi:hypothetical protein
MASLLFLLLLCNPNTRALPSVMCLDRGSILRLQLYVKLDLLFILASCYCYRQPPQPKTKKRKFVFCVGIPCLRSTLHAHSLESWV